MTAPMDTPFPAQLVPVTKTTTLGVAVNQRVRRHEGSPLCGQILLPDQWAARLVDELPTGEGEEAKWPRGSALRSVQ
jgi:hypothetical protein